VVIATHDLELAADLADRTIEIRDGAAIERASTASTADRAGVTDVAPASPASPAESEAIR
jgi:energy-coupling factor transporter ATP-binding protein EcfA2